MKKFVSLLTSMIVTLFVIGCSNPSSSSGGSLSTGGAGTIAIEKTFTNNLELLVSADELKNASEVTISFSNISEPRCWITITADTVWGIADALKGIDWETTEFKSVITDLDNASSYLSNGIYIAGTKDVTATITVSYK